MDNWVERRFLREANLRSAGNLWQEAITAIQDSCSSFRQHYFSARVQTDVHGNHLAVSIQPVAPDGRATQTLEINFDPSKPNITVRNRSEGRNKTFEIEADEESAFITHAGKRIDLDEFAQLVLEDALFTPEVTSQRFSYTME